VATALHSSARVRSCYVTGGGRSARTVIVTVNPLGSFDAYGTSVWWGTVAVLTAVKRWGMETKFSSSAAGVMILWRSFVDILTVCRCVRTPQETHYVSATKTSRLMPFRETVAVYCEKRTEHRSRDSSVGIAVGRTAEVQFQAGARDLSLPQRPGRIWAPFSLLFGGYLGLFPPG
jgi:hypothetical protein